MIEKISTISLDERKNIPGLNSARAEIILPGALILQEAMTFIRCPEVSFTEFALRDGLLVTEITDVKSAQARKRFKRLK